MWRKIAWAVAFGVCMGIPSRCGAQGDSPAGRLLTQCRWTRFEVVLGRIALTENHLGKKAVLNTDDSENGVREALSFFAKTPDSATLHYEFADAGQQMTVDVERSTQVMLRHLSQSDAGTETVRYCQPDRGAVSLDVQCAACTRQIAAPSFWHLLLAEPALCREHLIPILNTMRSGWQLESKAEQIEEQLLADARSGNLPDREQFAQLVRQLGHASFQRRQAADRQLRQMGQSVLALIPRLDPRTLNAEQRSRIRRIQRSLTVRDGDTPARVAAWLADDAHAWLALLDRPDTDTRVTAAQRLTAICGRALPCDPLAAEDHRRRQIEQLRQELGLHPPVMIGQRHGTTRYR